MNASRSIDTVTPAGAFITLEGVDGAGKSTQCALLCQALEMDGRRVRLLREPGGTKLGESIRRLLLDPEALDEGVAMSDVSELLLYEAARAQLVEQVVKPALAAGDIVVSDRFCDSTLAYQGVARGMGFDVVSELNRLACAGTVPDRTILLDIDPASALDRATAGHEPDRLEGEGARFERLVRQGYARLAADEPDRVRVIDAAGSVAQVYGRICDALSDLAALPSYEAVTAHAAGAES